MKKANTEIRRRWVRGMLRARIKNHIDHLGSHPNDFQAWSRLEQYVKVSANPRRMRTETPKLWKQSQGLHVVEKVILGLDDEVILAQPEEVSS